MVDIMSKRIETIELINNVKSVVNQMILDNEKITYYSVAEKAEVSRSFLYSHSELKELIEICRICSQKDEFAFRRQLLLNENKRLLQRLQAYEEQLINKFNCD